MTFIKSRRIQLGLTQEDVCEAIGVKAASLSRWENGVIKNMGMDYIVPLAKVLKCSPLDILGVEYSVKDNLTEQEETVVKAYRLADPIIQESVCKLLDVKFKQETSLLNLG